MTKQTLRSLISMIDPSRDPAHYAFYYRFLDFIGGNEEFSNPSNQQTPFYQFKQREPNHYLTGDELIKGDYLLYESCGHDGTYLIVSHDSIHSIRESILNPGGFLNSYTEKMVAIVHGRVKPFVIKGQNAAGNEITFRKYENDEEFSLCQEIWLEWTDEEREYSELEKNMHYSNPLGVLLTQFDSHDSSEFMNEFRALDPTLQQYFIQQITNEMEDVQTIVEAFQQALNGN